MDGLLIILLLAFGLLLLWISTQRRRGLLPEGRVVYEDSGATRRLEQPLFAEELNLVGRPDYLIENKHGLVPVEVKSGRTPSKPFQSHIFQLAAYCALVEVNFDQRPAYGIIRYPQRSFTVEFTEELERQLFSLLADMREALQMGELHRSHRNPARCNACGFLAMCDESL
jgi:CRISPR-associated exonuclease Cas4